MVGVFSSDVGLGIIGNRSCLERFQLAFVAIAHDTQDESKTG